MTQATMAAKTNGHFGEPDSFRRFLPGCIGRC